MLEVGRGRLRWLEGASYFQPCRGGSTRAGPSLTMTKVGISLSADAFSKIANYKLPNYKSPEFVERGGEAVEAFFHHLGLAADAQAEVAGHVEEAPRDDGGFVLLAQDIVEAIHLALE